MMQNDVFLDILEYPLLKSQTKGLFKAESNLIASISDNTKIKNMSN